MGEPASFTLAKEFLGKEVKIIIDRPLGSKHPQHGFLYESNYGYLAGVKSPDGEELDAYYLGVDKPIEKATGRCIAVVHRLKDDDDKLVVVPAGKEGMTDAEIEKSINFQEQWFEHEIIRI